ncbi:MAG: pyruvate kinase [Deltaproteobacteria bacterium]|nr:pyruvate kinase [Deltaproteobacteria bacterium]
MLQQRVKIVGTLGPASSSAEVIGALIRAGLDVVRLNFSHGSHEDHRRVYDIVRAQAEAARQHVAVLADLCGPKIRVGVMEGGGVELVAGRALTITTEAVVGTASRVSTSYTDLPKDAKPGAPILLDDGLLELVVRDVAAGEVRCEVVVGGVLKNNKGFNLPGTPLSTPALTEKDRKDLAFARELGVDYFALSFVQRPEDVVEAKALAGDIPVIAKIEKPDAVARLEEILAVADGVMVARGDLGVEAGAEKVPLIQKRMIRMAAERGLPVIVATQMLDSMIQNPRPTRAEVSDVANAVLDGADAVMLSGETASGRYPVEAVRTMACVIEEVEKSALFESGTRLVRPKEHSFSNAIAHAAVTASEDLGLKALAVYSETGHSAALVSACRPRAWIAAFSRHPAVLRRLALRWGVMPIRADWVQGVSGVVEQAERELLARGWVRAGDDIAVTFGMQDMSGPGRTDVLKLWRVRG